MSDHRRILITGAPGWLGTRLVQVLTEGGSLGSITQEPVQVRCLVEPGVDASDLERLNAEIVRCDLRRPDDVEGVGDGCEAVIHAAGIIHPRRIRDLYSVNVTGTRNLIAEAVRAGADRFVFVSSNSPAGVSLTHSHTMTEDEAPRPYFNYGRSKLEAETMINRRYAAGDIETVIIRPCWFYGPNQPARQSRFFGMIQSGRPMVFGDGNNLRSMSYIDNTVQGLLLALARSQAAGQTYWITDRRPYSFNEILQTVAEILEVESLRPRHLPALSSQMAKLADALIQGVGLYQKEIHVVGELSSSIAVSIDAAVRDLGYDPEVELEEGMRRSIEWCRANGADL